MLQSLGSRCYGRCLVRDENGASTPIFLDRENDEPRLTSRFFSGSLVAIIRDNAPDKTRSLLKPVSGVFL